MADIERARSMKECYVFDNREAAQGALDFIHSSSVFPLVGKNAKTGEPQPNKQKTERWADVKERVDGKFYFPRLPEAYREGLPQEQTESFNASFPHSVEGFESAWVIPREAMI